MPETQTREKRYLGRDEPGVFDHNVETLGSFKAYGNGLNQFSGPATFERWIEIPHRDADPTAWGLNEKGRTWFDAANLLFKFWDGTQILVLTNYAPGMIGLTEGAVPFGDADGYLSEDPTKLFWDDASDFLGVGVGAPVCTIHARLAECPDYAGIPTDTVMLLENVDNCYLQLQGGTANVAGVRFADDDYNPCAGGISYDFSTDTLYLTCAAESYVTLTTSALTCTSQAIICGPTAGGVVHLIRVDTNEASAYYELREDSDLKWSLGFDYDDSLSFKICEGTPGQNTRLIIVSGGLIQLPVDDQRIAFTGDTGGIGYKDSGGVERWMLYYTGSDCIQVCNRAANGAVRIRANTATAGAAGEVAVAEFQDDRILIYQDIYLQTQKELRFYDNGNYVGFEAPGLDADQIWVLPTADGPENEVLGTDGGGNLIWRTHDELAGYEADEHYPVLDEDDLNSDSDEHVATQQSIKAYVDASGGGASTFLDLTDTPGAYAGEGGKVVVVNATPDALEFTDALSIATLATSGAINSMFISVEANDNYILSDSIPAALTGDDNVFIGSYAGTATTTGYENVFIGYLAGSENTTGQENTFIGQGAGRNSQASYLCVAIGAGALYGVDGVYTAHKNTAIGHGAGYDVTSGSSNVCIGYLAGYYLEDGSNNTFIGCESGKGVDANKSDGNTCIGYRSGYGLTTGINNTFIGSTAGQSVTSGLNNVIIGMGAGISVTTSSANTAVGYYAGGGTGSGNTCFGNQAGKTMTTGGGNTCIGTQAGQNLNSSSNNTCIGVAAGLNQSTGSNNVYIGYWAGSSDDGACNIAIGYFAGQRKGSTSSYNIAIGYQCMIGDASYLEKDWNIAIGYRTLYVISTAQENIIIGSYSCYDLTTGDYNVGVGHEVMMENVTGSCNVVLGTEACKGVSTNSFSNNVVIGHQAMLDVTTGGNNVCIGYQAGQDLTTGTANVVIGYQAAVGQLAADNNKLWIANSNTATPLIYGEFDNAFITINGYLNITTLKSGATQVAAGAGANELWVTSGHDTLPDNVVMIGV